jgi:hypothetical protein
VAQFATPDELATRLGVSFSEEEENRAGELLVLASGLIQREAKQLIERVEGDILIRRGTSADRVRLPERPVVSISAVTLDAVPFTEEIDWYLEGDELVRTSSAPSSTSFGLSGGWGDAGRILEITYTHGFDPIPDAVKAVCLEATVRVWGNPGSVMQERYGSEQVSYLVQGVPSGLLLTDAEKQTISDEMRRTVRTVKLR